MNHYAVIGAGITGVTSAYALARRGHAVTLIEKQPYAGMETSYANGGQLSASNAEVWNHPGTLVKGLKWMFTPDAPLLMHPAPGWHKLSWLAEFLWAMRRYEAHTVATARLAIEARRHLFAWADAEGIDFDLRREGILHVYRDRAGFEHAGRVSRLLARGGLERRPVTPDEMRVIEPTLQGDFYGGYYTESDATGDIHKFTTGLATACERLGVRIRTGCEVVDTAADTRGVRVGLRQEGGIEPVQFDGIVVCAGVHSRRIAARLGDRLNVYPVKGYSITVNLRDHESQAAAPRVSLLDEGTKIVSSRLGDDRLRVAGTAEFDGFNLDIRADRVRPLVGWVRRCFPKVDTRSVVPWAGLRPMMPDMMPRVGPGRRPGVFYNTGHGHLGWTLSAITAQQVADAIDASESKRPAGIRARPMLGGA
jgi:D-amino-acid dehydrogenase